MRFFGRLFKAAIYVALVPFQMLYRGFRSLLLSETGLRTVFK